MTAINKLLILPLVSLNSERMRVLRVTKRLPQDEVAKQLGVTQALVSQWERGYREPGKAYRAKLARLLGVRVHDLFEVAS